MAVLDLCCYTQAFSNCGHQGLLFTAGGLLTAVAALVAGPGSRPQAQQLWLTSLVIRWHVIFLDCQTHVP